MWPNTCSLTVAKGGIPCVFTGEEDDDAEFDAPKIYEPIESLEQLAEKLKGYQEQYNETVRGAKMDLVFFKVKFIPCLLEVKA